MRGTGNVRRGGTVGTAGLRDDAFLLNARSGATDAGQPFPTASPRYNGTVRCRPPGRLSERWLPGSDGVATRQPPQQGSCMSAATAAAAEEDIACTAQRANRRPSSGFCARIAALLRHRRADACSHSGEGRRRRLISGKKEHGQEVSQSKDDSILRTNDVDRSMDEVAVSIDRCLYPRSADVARRGASTARRLDNNNTERRAA